MNSNEKVVFSGGEIYDGLQAFVTEVLIKMDNHPYINEKDEIKATRAELKQALIVHLDDFIDNNIERWIEQTLEARTVVLENNHATD